MAGSLDGHGHRPLVAGTGAELPARLDLAALRQVPPQVGDVLVVDDLDPLRAEHADLAAGGEPASGAATAPSTAAVVIAAVPVPATVTAPVAATLTTTLGTTAEARSILWAISPGVGTRRST